MLIHEDKLAPGGVVQRKSFEPFPLVLSPSLVPDTGLRYVKHPVAGRTITELLHDIKGEQGVLKLDVE